MDRDHLEATIWKHWPTRGTRAERSVSTILAAADAYAKTAVTAAAIRRHRKYRPPPARPILRHTGDTDLYPLIRALADALLGDEQEAAA